MHAFFVCMTDAVSACRQLIGPASVMQCIMSARSQAIVWHFPVNGQSKARLDMQPRRFRRIGRVCTVCSSACTRTPLTHEWTADSEYFPPYRTWPSRINYLWHWHGLCNRYHNSSACGVLGSIAVAACLPSPVPAIVCANRRGGFFVCQP